MEPYTCEDCDLDYPLEDGYLTEAGFECDACNSKRMDAERADYFAWAASSEGRIKQNYPDLDKHVAMSNNDPVGFYYACKNGTI